MAEPRAAATRRIGLFGGEIELQWLPERARRRAAPAALHVDHAPRILAEEALWRSADGRAVLTPNRYPFAKQALILWSTAPQREADSHLIGLAHDLAEPHGGSVLMNTLGAAATQPRAHLHLVGERLPFLASLATTKCTRPLPGDLGAVDVIELAAPFPGSVLGVRGERAARVQAAARLLQLRVAMAANLIADGTTTWIALRAQETPAPHFPYPLGCAELWGRCCFEDEAAFRAATPEALMAAFTAALRP